MEQFQRIYAVVDPDQEIQEIHENNNIGWTTIQINGSVLGIDDPNIEPDFELFPNFPNPFNPMTTIRYSIRKRAHVTLEIYNIFGQLIKTLVQQEQNPGPQNIPWDATNDRNEPVASGVYIYHLKVGQQMRSGKMVLIR